MIVQLLVVGIIMGAIYGLIGLGYSIIYRASGVMNMAQGEFITLGAFVGLTLYRTLGLPYAVALILTIVFMFVFGFALEKGAISLFEKRGVKGIYMMMITLGIQRTLNGTEQAIWTGNSFGFPSVFPEKTINVLGVALTPEKILCFFLAAIGMLLVHLFLTKTKLGKSCRASAMDPIASEACGINVNTSNAITWAIAATVAAVAGMQLGPIYGVSIALGTKISNKGSSASTVGGFGNIYGAMLGGILIGMVESLVGGYVNAAMKDMVAYLVLFLMLAIRPTGILNEKAIRDV